MAQGGRAPLAHPGPFPSSWSSWAKRRDDASAFRSRLQPRMDLAYPLLDLGPRRRGTRRLLGEVGPCVDVRRAAEIPDHRRSVQTPDVPHAVITDIAFLEEGHAQAVQSAVLVEVL